MGSAERVPGASLREDPWLAGLFGKPVYALAWPEGAGPEAAGPELDAASRGEVFMYAKVDPADVRSARSLEDRGFRLADTNVTLEKGRAAPAGGEPGGGTPGGDVRFRRAVPGDRDPVMDLARRSFRYSRFHLDPRIPASLADEIKARWAGNYFDGVRGDAMVVAEAAGRIAGFIQVLGAAAGDPVIDLIAVDGALRRQGLARSLSRFLESSLPAWRRIRVGTQLGNGPALTLYQALGYRVASARHVFHFHGPSGG